MGGPQPELCLLAPGDDARIVLLDEERRDGAVELREHDRDLCDTAVRDVDLLAEKDERVAVAPGGRADRLQVGPCMRLGEGDRGEAAVLRGQPGQIAMLLILRPEAKQGTDEKHRRADRGREPGAAPRELLGDERRRDRIDSTTAELLRDAMGGEAEGGGLRQQLERKCVRPVALGGDRTQLVRRKVVRERLQVALLVGQRERDHEARR